MLNDDTAPPADDLAPPPGDLIARAAALEARLAEAEAELHAQRRLSQIFERAPVGIYAMPIGPGGDPAYISPHVEQILGVAPAVWRDDPALWERQLHPDDRQRALDQLAHAITTGTRLRYEYRIRHRDGRWVWLHDEAEVAVDALGRPCQVQGFFYDITAQKEAEAGAHAQMAYFQELVEHMPIGIYHAGAGGAGPLLYVSPYIETLLGYGAAAWYAAPEFWHARIHPEDRAQVLTAFQAATRPGDQLACEYRLRHRDGQWVWVRDHATVCAGAAGSAPILVGFVFSITKRKHAEEALRESEERLRTMLSGMPVMLDAFDEQRRLTVWNAECERVTGYSAAELIGRDDVIATLYPDPAYRAAMAAEWGRRGGNFRNWELTITRKDGSPRIVSWSNVSAALPVPGWSFWAVGVDVTEQRRVEAALRESERRLRLAVAVAEIGTFELHPASGSLTISATYARLLGRGSSDITAPLATAIERIHPDDRQALQAQLFHTWASGGPDQMAFRAVRPDGDVRWLQGIGQTIYAPDGTPRRLVGVVVDITEQRAAQEAIQQLNADLEQRVAARTQELALTNAALRQEIAERTRAEEALRESRRFLDHVLRSSPSRVSIFDYSTRQTIYSTTSFVALLGYTAEELERMGGPFPLEQLMHPDDLALIPAQVQQQRAMADDAVIEREFRLRHADGGWRWFITRDVVFSRDASGRPSQILGQIFEITARKETEARLGEAVRQMATLNASLQRTGGLLHTIINSLDDGLALIGADGQVLMANRAVAAICRLDPAALVGRLWHAVCPFDSPVIARALAEGLAFSGRERLAHDGTPRSFDVRVLPLAADGAGRQLVLHLTEVTERLRFEDLAIQNERLAATGRLAAVVAHEVNSPLQAIQNLLFLAAGDNPDERARHLTMISDEIDRIGGLIRRLLDLQRPADAIMRQIDVNALIVKVLMLTSSTLHRHRVTASQALAADPGLVVGRGDQLTQVLLNLLMNAIDAMPLGGELLLQSLQRPPTAADGLMGGPAQVVVIVVSDTGHGIPEVVLPRIFEQFYTTKAAGSGLGLAISRQIVEQHGGRIDARNHSGGGAAFTVILPAAEPDLSAAPYRQVPPLRPVGR